METQKKQNKTVRIIVVCIVAALLGTAIWYTLPHANQGKFCFDFSHDMQFSSTQQIAHPVNQGKVMLNGTYYLPEVPALQEALKRQGFYIDPYENTGGKVYAAAFFGPSTHAAVMDFQKKSGLPQTGDVDNATIDKLSALYKCPASTASTTSSVMIVGTTTPKK